MGLPVNKGLDESSIDRYSTARKASIARQAVVVMATGGWRQVDRVNKSTPEA